MFYTNTNINIQFLQYFKKALQSLFTKQMLVLSILPFICSLSIWIIFIIIGINNFHLFIYHFPNIWIEYSLKSGILPTISYYLLMLFATITMLLYGTILYGVCIMIINSFMSPLIVSFIHKNYFLHVKLNSPSFLDSMKYSLLLFIKTFIKFTIFSFLCFLLSFIGLGFIGLLIGVFVYFNFYCKNINHEVALNIMNEKEYTIFLQNNKISLFIINIFIFIPLYIPLLNLFATTWQIIILTHFIMSWYEKYANTSKGFIEETEIIELKS